ncbi:MAG: DUF4224 domain-containing protein [Achromobacter veterisilvae]
MTASAQFASQFDTESPPSAGFSSTVQTNEYLSASELAALVQCKPNQRKMMERWLTREGWPYALGKNGVPRVLRAYRDKKLGISDGKQKARLSSAPNREAFTHLGKNRNSTALQARRRPAY